METAKCFVSHFVFWSVQPQQSVCSHPILPHLSRADVHNDYTNFCYFLYASTISMVSRETCLFHSYILKRWLRGRRHSVMSDSIGQWMESHWAMKDWITCFRIPHLFLFFHLASIYLSLFLYLIPLTLLFFILQMFCAFLYLSFANWSIVILAEYEK